MSRPDLTLDNITMTVFTEGSVHVPLKERVQRGVQWLNVNHPGWAAKVNLDKLNMLHAPSCVLGQVIGQPTWYYTIQVAGLSEVQAAFLGFCTGNRFEPFDGNYEELTPLWRAAILDNLGVEGVETVPASEQEEPEPLYTLTLDGQLVGHLTMDFITGTLELEEHRGSEFVIRQYQP